MSLITRIQDLATRVATEFNTVRQELAAAGGGGYFEVIIWAEENGGMAANAEEWSYGNGAVGADIGIPSFWNCEAVGMVFNAETVGTSITVNLKINSVNVESITSTTRDAFVDFAAPISVSRGDRINFRTGALSGTWTDGRVGVVLRVQT